MNFDDFMSSVIDFAETLGIKAKSPTPFSLCVFGLAFINLKRALKNKEFLADMEKSGVRNPDEELLTIKDLFYKLSMKKMKTLNYYEDILLWMDSMVDYVDDKSQYEVGLECFKKRMLQ